MALLAPHALPPAGVELTFTTVNGAGDTVRPVTGREKLLINNGNAAQTTVTINVYRSTNGLATPNRTATVATTKVRAIPLLPEYVDPATGLVTFVCAPSATVGAAILAE